MKKLLLLFFLTLNISIYAQFPSPYCANTFTSSGGIEPITLVNFAGINNTSPATLGTTQAHQNFISIVGNVVAGNSYPIVVKGNTGGNYNNNISMFADWNNDNDFLDSGESFNVGNLINSTGIDAVQVTSTIQVPGNAFAGNVRMRIIKEYNSSQTVFPLPCRIGVGYGQSEDYTLSVSVPACITPYNGSAVVDNFALSANLNWTSPSVNNEIVFQLASASAPSNTPNFGINVNSSTYFVDNLLPDNLYEFYVRTECTDGLLYSTWAGPFAFNTFLPPLCTTVIYPLNGAINIPAGTTTTTIPVVFSWNAVTDATSYDFYYGFSTDPAATSFLGNYAMTSASINITGYSILVYWRIVPRNVGGVALSCVVNSFTTAPNPLSSENFYAKNFSISPNPADKFINVSNTDNINISEINITDLNGRIVKSQKVNNVANIEINVADLTSGMYLMNINTEKGIVTKKIMKN